METLFPNSNIAIRLNVMRNFMHFMEEAILQGYQLTFTRKTQDLITDQYQTYVSEDICVHRIYSFEGESDEDDRVNLYLLETKDGRRGTLVHVYSKQSNDHDIYFSDLDDCMDSTD